MTRCSALASAVHAVAFGALLLATAAPAQAANSGFVSASGGQFVLNGRPFYFVGSNAYYLVPAATWGATNYTDETMTMAQSLGFTVFRAWGFFDDPGQATALQSGPGVYNEASFRAMDYVLYKADQAGVRLLISLVNYWGDFGGMPQYVRWCSPGSSTDAFYTNASCRQLYKNYVSHLVNRVNTYNGRLYRNDPTIFAWELANEPRSGDRTGQLVRGWIAEMAAYIKSIDSNHMVTTGEEGFDLTTAGYNSGAYNNQSWLFDGTNGISFTQNTADPNIDFAQIHLYPEYWNFSPSIGSTWIADHTQIARQLRKPLLLGEFGHAVNSAAVYDEWLRTFDTENGGGALVWQLMCGSCYAMRDQFGVQYPPNTSVSDVLQRAAVTANAKKGTPSDNVPPGSRTGITIGSVSVSPETVDPGQGKDGASTITVTSGTGSGNGPAFVVTSTGASPSAVAQGGTINIRTSVRSSQMTSAIVDLEIYDASGTKVGQNACRVSFTSSGKTKNCRWSYVVPSSLASGLYTVKVGVFSSDWSVLYVWLNRAGVLTVQ